MNLLNMLKAHLVSNGRAAPTENSLIIDESYASSIISQAIIGFANNRYENISRLLSRYTCCPYALAYALDVVQPSCLLVGRSNPSTETHSASPLTGIALYPSCGSGCPFLAVPPPTWACRPMTSR